MFTIAALNMKTMQERENISLGGPKMTTSDRIESLKQAMSQMPLHDMAIKEVQETIINLDKLITFYEYRLMVEKEVEHNRKRANII
jgi:hypothetical protein